MMLRVIQTLSKQCLRPVTQLAVRNIVTRKTDIKRSALDDQSRKMSSNIIPSGKIFSCNKDQRRYLTSPNTNQRPIPTTLLCDWTPEEVATLLQNKFSHKEIEPFVKLQLSGKDIISALQSPDGFTDLKVIDQKLAYQVKKHFEDFHKSQKLRLPSITIDDETIANSAKIHLDEALALMKASTNLEQQQSQQKLLAKPLPVVPKSGILKETYFYPELELSEPKQSSTERSSFEEFEQAVRWAAGGSQNSSVINLVQTIGVGKTHFAMRYALKHGGIVIRFVEGGHIGMVETANEVLNHEFKSNPILNGKDFDTELNWTKYGMTVMELIPLTFVQYAEAFYAAANGMNLSKEDTRVAFQRAINAHKASIFIHEMYKATLAKYPYYWMHEAFKQKMITTARELGLKAFHYDEIQHLEELMKGKFMHYSYAVDKRSCLEQLKNERKGDFKNAKHFSRPSSLLYCFMLAIEGLALQISQVVLTPKNSSSAILMTENLGMHSRDRPLSKTVIINDDIPLSIARFKQLAAYAFGPDIVPLLEPHEDTLKKLASRADYLFGSFPTMVRDIKADNLEDLVDKYLTFAVQRAQHMADQYVAKALSDESKEIASIFLRVALGNQVVEVSKLTLERLSTLGVMQFKEPQPYELFMTPEGIKVREAYPFIHQSIVQLPVTSLMDMVEKLEPSSLSTLCRSELNEFAVNLIMKTFAAKSLPLSSLVPDLSLENTIAVQNKLNHQLHLLTDCKGYKFFEDVGKYQGKILQPTDMTLQGEVAIVQTLEGTPAGYLLVKCNVTTQIVNFAQLKEALLSLEPKKLYVKKPKTTRKPVSRDSIKKWQTLLPTIKDRVWIRMIFARGFESEATKAVKSYNATETGKKYPIILVTTVLLPKKLQRDNLAPKKAKSGTPSNTLSNEDLEAAFGLKFN